MKANKSLTRVLIMAGGTGGHVFPGLAVAHYLKAKKVEVHWLGTVTGLEAKVVPEANIPLHFIKVKGVRGKGLKTLLTAPFKIMSAVAESINAIKEIKPDVVIGLGGFASGPGGMASWLTKYPLVIHEQNAKPGFTNKVLALFSKKVLEGFPNAFKASKHIVEVGNPVREEITKLEPPEQRLDLTRPKMRLLVLGGSLGAKAINEMVPKAIALLKPENRPEIWHQTGTPSFEETKNLYASMHLEAKLQPFIKDMAEAYNWADMVVCRAGALTVAELCTVGLGSILIPFPHAMDNHQFINAQYLVQNEAAICIEQKALTAENLSELLQKFFHNPEQRLNMAKAAYKLRKINVVEQIFDILVEVAQRN